MGYKQGIARDSSAALLIFSFILLAFYIGCSNTCTSESRSFYSPIWTAVSGMFIAFIGLGMSASKAEKKCGCCFLSLCILLILTGLACVFLTWVAFFAEIFNIGSSQQQFPNSNGQVTPSPTPYLPSNTSDIAPILWLCMMGTAGVIVIISIVASCMFCCCQEARQQINETRLVLTSGVPGQSVIVNNEQFVLQPAQPNTIIVTTGALPAVVGDNPPPYSAVVNQGLNTQVPASGYSNVWATTTASSGPVPVRTNEAAVANSTPTAPPVSMDSTIRHEYMQLQQTSPVQSQNAATNSSSTDRLDQMIPVSDIPTTTIATEEQYSYIENTDSNVGRARIPTPDEYYDDVGEPERPPRGADDSTYVYASTEDLRNAATISSRGNPEYVNERVRRPTTGDTREPTPVMHEYLDILP